MTTMKRLNFNQLYVILCAVMCINLSSCGDEPVVAPNTDTTSNSKGGDSGSGKDDDNKDDDDFIEGTITVNLPNNGSSESGIVIIDKSAWSIYLYINSVNNFEITYISQERHSGDQYAGGYDYLWGEIVDMGERTMNKVNSLPSKGWVKTTAVLPKHSYICKSHYEYNEVFLDENFNEKSRDHGEKIAYKKIYVEKWNLNKDNEIIGAVVQYVDWTPEDTK